MMDTVLNVGLNPDCVPAMAERTGNRRGAWEGVSPFPRHVRPHRRRHRRGRLHRHLCTSCSRRPAAKSEDDLDAAQMEDLCGRLARRLRTAAPAATCRPNRGQMLARAINAVFGSWNNERAITYRKHHHIDGLLGTAVNVQMMCPSEVSGVMFTANPVNPRRSESSSNRPTASARRSCSARSRPIASSSTRPAWRFEETRHLREGARHRHAGAGRQGPDRRRDVASLDRRAGGRAGAAGAARGRLFQAAVRHRMGPVAGPLLSCCRRGRSSTRRRRRQAQREHEARAGPPGGDGGPDGEGRAGRHRLEPLQPLRDPARADADDLGDRQPLHVGPAAVSA